MGKKNSSTVDEREPILAGDRLPVGAVLRIGRKNPQHGAPEMQDRFFVVSRHESETMFGDRKGTVREPLPGFKVFNDLTMKHPVRSFRGVLVRAERRDLWDFGLRAQQLPGKEWQTPPNRRPACSSKDGITATRFYGTKEDGSEDWREIDCPRRACEFQQEIDTGRKDRSGKSITTRPCRIFSRMWFVPRWDDPSLPAEFHDLPSPLMMWANRSIESSENVEGCLNFIEAVADENRITHWSFADVPFILTLTMKTKPQKGYRYPVVDMAVDGSLINAFTNARAAIELAGGQVPLRIATSLEESDPDIVDADAIDISEPAVPGSTNGRLPLFEGD